MKKVVATLLLVAALAAGYSATKQAFFVGPRPGDAPVYSFFQGPRPGDAPEYAFFVGPRPGDAIEIG